MRPSLEKPTLSRGRERVAVMADAKAEWVRSVEPRVRRIRAQGPRANAHAGVGVCPATPRRAGAPPATRARRIAWIPARGTKPFLARTTRNANEEALAKNGKRPNRVFCATTRENTASIGDAERAAARARAGVRARDGVVAFAEGFSVCPPAKSRRNRRRTCTTSRPPTQDGHRVSPVSRAKKLVSSPFSFSLPPAGSWRSHGWKYALEHSAEIHRSSGGNRASSWGRGGRRGAGSASLSAMPRIDLRAANTAIIAGA